MSPCALYRHFDDLGTLLYVGISQDPHVRTAGHVAGSEWVQFARRGSVDWFPTTEAALVAEAFAIRTEGPVFNRIHAVNNRADRIAAYYDLRNVHRQFRPKPRQAHAMPMPEPEGVTLHAAAGLLGLTLKALRNARQRDVKFPSVVERPGPGQPARYRLTDLEKWAANRPSVVREKDRP